MNKQSGIQEKELLSLMERFAFRNIEQSEAGQAAILSRMLVSEQASLGGKQIRSISAACPASLCSMLRNAKRKDSRIFEWDCYE